MANLTQQLQEWVTSELISAQQATRISDYEKAKPARHWVLYGILSVGVSVLAIGIISLIAANWSDIPSAVKLAANFIILAGLAGFIYQLHRDEKIVFFEVGIVFYAALILASIGLIAQIYHTGGDLYQALVLWLVMLLPLAMCTQRAPLPQVWLMIFMGAVIALFDAKGYAWFAEHESDVALSLLFAAPVVLWILARFALGLMPNHAFARVFKFWAVVLGCIAVVTLEICAEAGHSFVVSYWVLGCLSSVFALALALVVVTPSSSATHRKVLLLLIVTYVVDVLVVQLNIQHSQGFLMTAVFSIVIASFAAFYFALSGSRRLFNFFTLLVAVRFLIIYFDAMGGLATTGIGLIISGALILGLGWAWYKHHGRIQTLVEGMRL